MNNTETVKQLLTEKLCDLCEVIAHRATKVGDGFVARGLGDVENSIGWLVQLGMMEVRADRVCFWTGKTINEVFEELLGN